MEVEDSVRCTRVEREVLGSARAARMLRKKREKQNDRDGEGRKSVRKETVGMRAKEKYQRGN